MDIRVRGSVGFTSLNHPIKPFKIKTNQDVISFSEIDYTKNASKDFLQDVSNFFLDNFANQSAHPYWKQCRKDAQTFKKEVYDDYIKECMLPSYSNLIQNPDTTMLLGKSSDGKICAGIVSTPLNLSAKVNNDRTLYIDSLAVDKEYRKNHIAQKLMNSVIDTSKGRYDDAFLVAYKESVPFYAKQGFVDTTNQELIDEVAKERKDYPEFASCLSKKL